MLTVGLFDQTFRHDVCSTAWKTPRHIQYLRDDREFTGVTLFTDGHLYGPDVAISKSRHKLGWLHEPPELIERLYSNIGKVSDRFEKIVTYHPDLLTVLPNSVFGIYGGVWIEEKDWGLKSKTNLCSMLIGSKMATSGHRIRHAIADQLPRSVSLFGSRGTPTDYSITTKLSVLAKFAFTIVTEAQRLDNLWTEILADCFAVGTIPVFWGCPNVARYFNPAGILSFDTPAQAAEIVAGLSFDLYESMLPAVADNLARVAQYAVAEDYLYLNILKEYDHA